MLEALAASWPSVALVEEVDGCTLAQNICAGQNARIQNYFSY